MRAGIAIGSNLGNRQALLQQAVQELRKLNERGQFLSSSIHETPPHDCPPGAPRFLNAVVELETTLSPLPLLHRLQNLERAAGRPLNHAHHAPRTLDLDLLYCDEMTISTPELELPHPRIAERLFVLAPLAEIRPDLILKNQVLTCSELLSKVSFNVL